VFGVCGIELSEVTGFTQTAVSCNNVAHSSRWVFVHTVYAQKKRDMASFIQPLNSPAVHFLSNDMLEHISLFIDGVQHVP
jgi:hypothetical protein